MRESMKLGLLAGLVCATALSACSAYAQADARAAAAAPAQGPAMPDGDWRTINRDLAATRFSPLDEINKSNVSQLAEAWSYPLRGFNNAVPLVVGGTM
jgi:glucose dehydrogenase